MEQHTHKNNSCFHLCKKRSCNETVYRISRRLRRLQIPGVTFWKPPFPNLVATILTFRQLSWFPWKPTSVVFQFLMMAFINTDMGRCRRLRRLPIPHRRVIQEPIFKNWKNWDSSFWQLHICMVFKKLNLCFFEFLVMPFRNTELGRCRRFRRLPIPHRRVIQEPYFKNWKNGL